MLFLNIIYRTDAILPYLENAKSDLRPKHKELCVLHKRQNAVEIKKSLMISANLATSKSNTSARNNNSSSNTTPTTSFSSNITTFTRSNKNNKRSSSSNTTTSQTIEIINLISDGDDDNLDLNDIESSNTPTTSITYEENDFGKNYEGLKTYDQKMSSSSCINPAVCNCHVRGKYRFFLIEVFKKQLISQCISF